VFSASDYISEEFCPVSFAVCSAILRRRTNISVGEYPLSTHRPDMKLQPSGDGAGQPSIILFIKD